DATAALGVVRRIAGHGRIAVDGRATNGHGAGGSVPQPAAFLPGDVPREGRTRDLDDVCPRRVQAAAIHARGIARHGDAVDVDQRRVVGFDTATCARCVIVCDRPAGHAQLRAVAGHTD